MRYYPYFSSIYPREKDMMLNPKETLNSEKTRRNVVGKSANRKIWPFLEIKTKEEINIPVLCSFHQPSTDSTRAVKPFLETSEINNQRSDLNNDSECFHCAIGAILGIAQLFGVLPLSGIRSPSSKNLIFNLRSFRTLYSLFIMFLLVFIAVVSLMHMVKTLRADTLGKHGGIGAATAGAIFYGNSLSGLVLFMWLSPRWILLQKEWRSMELYLGRCKQSRPRLRWKFQLITIIVMSIALIEHILSIINSVPEKDVAALENNATWRSYLRIYTFNSHGFILTTFDYNIGLGIFLFIISKVATFTWNFTDLFIMLVSTGLAERYKRLNHVLLKSSNTKIANLDWREFREYFATLSALVKRADNDISPIILLSFVNNLYFICLQLLNGLSIADSGLLNSVYFFFSFAFLVGRTVAVTLFTARIYDQSKIVLPVLYNCPGSNYTIEIQRLQFQLTSDDVCLTGLKFFSITRNFMLAVAGAIATYEVVLLQFNVAMNK